MSVIGRRIFSFAILALCVLVAAANVAQAAAQLDPACCHRSVPAESLAAPDAPCDGFLPLTCCHAAALPGGDHASLQPPAEFAATAIATITPTPPAAIQRFDDTALSPHIAAIRLTVVRQL